LAIPIEAYKRTFLIPEQDDPCAVWIGYFVKLKKEVGSANAKILWLLTWKSNGSLVCTTNPNFSKWLQKNDLDVSNLATRSISDISEIGGNLFGMGKNITKVLSIGVPVVLGIVLVVLLVLLRNTSKDVTITDLAMLTPMGRGAKLLGK